MALSQEFFHEVVEPLAETRLGRGVYAAALLGGGSEVLGLDSDVSSDHDWGPRVILFVEPELSAEAASISADLPDSFGGVSRHFGAPAGGAPWVHPFEVSDVRAYFTEWVGFSTASEATLVQWLARPAMSFLAVTAGTVFHDGPGDLTIARRAASFYPDDVWRWLVACQWRRIGEEESFIDRAASAGDMLGARIVLGRVARDAIRLAFLLERRYAPYSKWLGAAFATLPLASDLGPMLASAMSTLDDTGSRHLGEALEVLGAETNQRLGTRVEPARRPYYGRAMFVAPASDFVEAILSTVGDELIRSIPTDVGNVDMLYGTNNGSAPAAQAAYEAILTR
jgi:hypothetical protein